MAKDSEGITVHTMNSVHRMGPVFYASVPRDAALPKAQGTNGEKAKRGLVSILWDYLVAMDSARWRFCLSLKGAAFPIQVVRDLLGKPHLLLGAHRGPAISFSEGGGRVWAALCGDESEMGIDVAEAVEFQGGYPVHRVFNEDELQRALKLTGGDLGKASALLWSVKEAVVKALGCAFHHVDPLQVHVYPSIGGDDGFTFPVRLSGRALARFPVGTGQSLWARSFPRAEMWLSIAVLNRQVHTDMGGSMLCAGPALAAARRMPQCQPLPDPAGLLSSQRGTLE